MGVGKELKKIRLKENISLEEIAEETIIRKKYLEDIEKERYDSIPGEAYVKAFIKSYAEYMGLNGKKVVEFYQEQQQLEQAKNEVNEERINGGRSKVFQQKSDSKKKILLPLLIIILAAIFFVLYHFGLFENLAAYFAGETNLLATDLLTDKITWY